MEHLEQLLHFRKSRKDQGLSIATGLKSAMFVQFEPVLAGCDPDSFTKIHRAVRYGTPASGGSSRVASARGSRSNSPAPDSTSGDRGDHLGALDRVPDDLRLDEVEVDSGGGAKAGGAFADVYTGRYRGRSVAIKAVRKNKDIPPAIMNKRFQKEARTWWNLEDDNVLPLLGFIERPDISPHKLMVSPWCEHGTLADFMEKNPRMRMSMRIDLFCGIAKGLKYLHTPRGSQQSVVVHGDLKPANILLDSNWTPKLGDFGLVRVIHDGPPSGYTTASSHLGTLRYLAHELLEDENAKKSWWPNRTTSESTKITIRPTTSSDIYALGSIGMEIMTSITPHASISGEGYAAQCALIEEIKNGIPPAKRPDGTHGAMKEMWDQIFEPCWKHNPSKRPTADKIYSLLSDHQKDPFFLGCDSPIPAHLEHKFSLQYALFQASSVPCAPVRQAAIPERYPSGVVASTIH